MKLIRIELGMLEYLWKRSPWKMLVLGTISPLMGYLIYLDRPGISTLVGLVTGLFLAVPMVYVSTRFFDWTDAKLETLFRRVP